jgi:hypothetical protein
MKLNNMLGLFSMLALMAGAPTIAQADDQTPTTEEDADGNEQGDNNEIGEYKERKVGAGEKTENLPAPQSDDDPQPTPASPSVPMGGVVKQAGTGGVTAYGRSGVLELGGSANFTNATDFTQLSLNPSIGWFFMDNVEISAILGLSHLSAQGVDATFVNLLAEPSLHIPFTDTFFGMLGVGAGLSYVEGPGIGFALAPRIGANILIGRSGILTPQFYLSYATHEAIATPSGTLLAVNVTYGAGLGYTVMW